MTSLASSSSWTHYAAWYLPIGSANYNGTYSAEPFVPGSEAHITANYTRYQIFTHGTDVGYRFVRSVNQATTSDRYVSIIFTTFEGTRGGYVKLVNGSRYGGQRIAIDGFIYCPDVGC